MQERTCNKADWFFDTRIDVTVVMGSMAWGWSWMKSTHIRNRNMKLVYKGCRGFTETLRILEYNRQAMSDCNQIISSTASLGSDSSEEQSTMTDFQHTVLYCINFGLRYRQATLNTQPWRSTDTIWYTRSMTLGSIPLQLYNDTPIQD